jgi:hypothetical protein
LNDEFCRFPHIPAFTRSHPAVKLIWRRCCSLFYLRK